MTPKCEHNVDADACCARCQLRQECYSDITEAEAKTMLSLCGAGLFDRLKPYADWQDAVEAAADTLELDYDYPKEPTIQQALEVVDSSQWVNSRGYQMSAIIYGTWFAWLKHGGLLDAEDPYPDLARFAMAHTVLEIVEGRVTDREDLE